MQLGICDDSEQNTLKQKLRCQQMAMQYANAMTVPAAAPAPALPPNPINFHQFECESPTHPPTSPYPILRVAETRMVDG